jgi:hypothetical protein
MARSRILLPGLAAALLVLMVQLAAGAWVPTGLPGTGVLGTLCHAADGGPGTPAPPPGHPDCPVCPLCSAVHAMPTVLLPTAAALPLARLPLAAPGPRVARFGAPGAAPRPPNQPRAPPPSA